MYMYTCIYSFHNTEADWKNCGSKYHGRRQNLEGEPSSTPGMAVTHRLKDESEFPGLVRAGQDQVDDEPSLCHVNVR